MNRHKCRWHTDDVYRNGNVASPDICKHPESLHHDCDLRDCPLGVRLLLPEESQEVADTPIPKSPPMRFGHLPKETVELLHRASHDPEAMEEVKRKTAERKKRCMEVNLDA